MYIVAQNLDAAIPVMRFWQHIASESGMYNWIKLNNVKTISNGITMKPLKKAAGFKVIWR